MIQYTLLLEILIRAGDYWIPAFAGMTAVFVDWPSRFRKPGNDDYTRIGIST